MVDVGGMRRGWCWTAVVGCCRQPSPGSSDPRPSIHLVKKGLALPPSTAIYVYIMSQWIIT